MTLMRTALILTIVTLICFLRPNAVGESSLFDKSLPEVLETTRLLYGNEGSAFSTLIQGLSEYTRKVDPQTSEEVKTNMNLFPEYQEQILKDSKQLLAWLKDVSANHDTKKKVATLLIHLNETISNMNNLDTEVLLKLSRSMTKDEAEVLSHLFYPFTSQAFLIQQVMSIHTQQYIAQEL
jgi:hypothetical protein